MFLSLKYYPRSVVETGDRIEKLREKMKEEGLAAYIVPSTDSHGVGKYTFICFVFCMILSTYDVSWNALISYSTVSLDTNSEMICVDKMCGFFV